MSPREPLLAKFDATRDLKGTFYVTGELEKKYIALKLLLERRFKTKLSGNGNTH